MTTGITITSQLPSGVTWDPTTRIIRVDGTVDVPLTAIRIMVTDQGMVELCEMTVATYRLLDPTITLTDARVEVFGGEQVSIQLLVDAKGRDPFPVTIPGLPDWLTWDKQTNLISGQAPRVEKCQFDMLGDGVKYASGTVIAKAKPGATPSPGPSGDATASPTPAPTPGALEKTKRRAWRWPPPGRSGGIWGPPGLPPWKGAGRGEESWRYRLGAWNPSSLVSNQPVTKQVWPWCGGGPC